ncbi:hypothetical protein GWN26_01140 [Candidatus Saccharibacteria bacterium]|nr:hypothetical protein [Candidatus Saccharibacteria bacterium]NIV03209.1 hypothetical protein [Calditrichia bacterium]NIS37714.1 hypothetical protein [Candidatus Saccharibacteria bacterium]NIV71321.1 hypothetical protein [Calditrichia bacterium]NIV97813.1 hypothetical protein [Candidatus Saccharibacteria bacterium]
MSKTVNYTPEQTEIIKGMYLGVADEGEARRDEVVKEIAAMYGKSVRSVIAKLSRMDVYIAKKHVAKDGQPAIRKDAAAARLREITGLPLVSAENLTKTDLKALIARIEELREGQSDEDSDLA